MKDNGLKQPKHYIERYLNPKVNLLTHNSIPHSSTKQGAKNISRSAKSTIAEIEMLTLGRCIRSLDTGIDSVYFDVYTKR